MACGSWRRAMSGDGQAPPNTSAASRNSASTGAVPMRCVSDWA